MAFLGKLSLLSILLVISYPIRLIRRAYSWFTNTRIGRLIDDNYSRLFNTVNGSSTSRALSCAAWTSISVAISVILSPIVGSVVWALGILPFIGEDFLSCISRSISLVMQTILSVIIISVTLCIVHPINIGALATSILAGLLVLVIFFIRGLIKIVDWYHNDSESLDVNSTCFNGN